MPTLSYPSLILASISPYRRELLTRLRIPFTTQAPHVDEMPLSNELPIDLSRRLGLAKAHAVAALHPEAVVIGSDQVVDWNQVCLGKPLTHEKAIEQLELLQGQMVLFHSSVAFVCLKANIEKIAVSTTRVKFRPLTTKEIESYLLIEKPYDCAGSAKSEGLGIALLESIENNDPTSLIGLPLTIVSAFLRDIGMNPLLGALP